VKLFSKNSNLCDHNPPTSQTDRQTERQTTCDGNTALCTKVHRAVKTKSQCSTIVRNTVVRATFKVNGKPPILGSRSSVTPWPIDLKFELSDYVGDMTQHAKNCTDRPRRPPRQRGEMWRSIWVIFYLFFI